MQKKHLLLIVPLFLLTMALSSYATDEKSSCPAPTTCEQSETGNDASTSDSKKEATPPAPSSDQEDHVSESPDNDEDSSSDSSDES